MTPSERKLLLAPAKLLLYLSMIAAALYMAGLKDHGITRPWPTIARLTWGVAILLLMLNGMVRIAALVMSFVQGEDYPGLAPALRGYLTFFTVFIVAASIALVASESMGIHPGIALATIGALTLSTLALWRPRWFTVHPGIQALDQILSPRGTTILYILAGAALVWAAFQSTASR
jgi:hypothetical protein